jgi:thiol reductant ABC exporter CydC subunit
MRSPSEVASHVDSAKRLLALAAPGRRRFLTACGLGVLAVGCGVGLIACAAWLISAASLQPHIATLTVAIVGVRVFALGKAALRYGERLVSHDVAFRMLATIRMRFVAALEPLSPGALPVYHRGDLLARMVSDIDGLRDLPLRVLQPVAVAAGAAALAVGIVATLLPSSAAVLATTLAIAAVAAPAVTSWANRRADARLAKARADLSTGVVTLLNARADLVAYGAASQHLAKLSALDAGLTRIARSSALAAGVGAGLSAVCAGAAVWGALALGTSAVRDDVLSGVMLAVVVLIPLAAFEAVQVLPTATLAYSRSRQSGERVVELMETPVPVTERANVRRLDRANLWPISLQGAGARWPNTHSSAPAAVTGVDLELMPGHTIAVVGASGSGKTTLSAMLLRFVELSSGGYHLGGVNARDIPGDEVRRMVGLCAQDAHIFDSTIRENLRLARPDCDDDDLRDALRRVRLLEWVERLPDGLDTHVGEGGQRLSEGERRRISVARALLADFPAIVFDEPTANLDQPTADALVRDLLAATADRATMVITHRLSALEFVDEIIVLKNGSVAERGKHDQLVLAGGLYTHSWRSEHGRVQSPGRSERL